MNLSELREKALKLKDDASGKFNEVKIKILEIKENTTLKANELKDKTTELSTKASDLKDKSKIIKDDITTKTDDALKYSKNKYYTFKFGVQTKEELDFIIKKSATSSIINKETGVEKFYKHKMILIFVDEGSDFMKKALYVIPVIVAKAFSQNITVKLAKSKIEGVDLSEYQIDETKLPTMIIFEEEKFYKKIEGEENILKLVKSFNLDINELIENV